MSQNYVEPKDLIKNNKPDNIDRLLSGRNAAERRTELENSMYDNLMQHSQPTRISMSDFEKYEILYNTETRKAYLEHKLTDEELRHIEELSQEFYSYVNVHQEIHIVNEYTNDVVLILPPVFTSLSTIRSSTNEIIDVIHNIAVHDDGNAGGVVPLKRAAAMNYLTKEMVNNQNISKLKQANLQYHQTVQEFNKKMGIEDAVPVETTKDIDTHTPVTSVEDTDSLIDSLFD